MQDFAGKKALITGGTRGLGRAAALQLATGGASVAMNYKRDRESADKTLAEIHKSDEVQKSSPKAVLLQADLEDEGQVRSMVRQAGEELGGLDIFIANAAATAFKPLLDVKAHNLTRTFNLSVGSFVAAVQEASKLMHEGGLIVMVSGIDSVRFAPGHGVLGAAKAALESMVRDLAFELGPRGITVNGVNMGLIDTDSSRLYFGEDFERVREVVCERSALRRIPTLDEIASVICFLCSDAASYVTAQTIMVDGGLTLGNPWAR